MFIRPKKRSSSTTSSKRRFWANSVIRWSAIEKNAKKCLQSFFPVLLFLFFVFLFSKIIALFSSGRNHKLICAINTFFHLKLILFLDQLFFRIRLKDLSDSTDISALAKEVVDKCKLIPAAKLPEVEQLLFYLQKRNSAQGSDFFSPTAKSRDSYGLAKDMQDVGADVKEVANLNKLDDYVEMLYEEVKILLS